MLNLNRLIISLFLILFSFGEASALSSNTAKDAIKIVEIAYQKLKPSQIDELTELTKKRDGVKEVGKILAAKNLTESERSAIYLKILTNKGLITEQEAGEYFKNLNLVPGFSSTIRKAMGASSRGSSGHLAEIQQANAVKNQGWEVVSIGEKFSDGIKKGLTDIDLRFNIGKRKYIAEIKNYQEGTSIPLDKWRSDMESLAAYQKINAKSGEKIDAIFIVRNIPKSDKDRKLLEQAARNYGVRILFGEPDTIVRQLTL